jgi:hypothetical protein
MSVRPASVLVLVLLLAGCAADRPPGSAPISADAANGQAIATVLGTPFYALFKATSCLVTTVIVVPSSAALALTERPERDGEREALHEGLGRNCFGSYVLEPI